MKSLRANSIGMLTWDYAQPKGGMGRALQQTVRMLTESGRTVHVASPQADTPLLACTQRSGGHLLFSALLPYVLRRWIKKMKVQLLMLPIGPGGVFLLRPPRVPCVGIVYHTYAQQAAAVPGQAWKKIFIPFERLTLRRCTRIICYSPDTERVLIETYNVPAEHIDVCAHYLDLASWQKAGERTAGLCVCIARLEARKGVDVIVQAWPEVVRSVPHARLLIVGRGVQEAAVDAHIVVLHGTAERRAQMPLAELQHLLGRAEVALCPAYLEGYGLAAAEAMASGACVVAADSDGLRSLITHEVNGLLVQPGDVHGFAVTIIRALQNEELRTRLSLAARAHIEQVCNASRAAQELLVAVEAAEMTEGRL